ncbi:MULTISPECIES: porin [unclassified Aureimonas]|uniref:porin n=1 Tax=unclassified Aureimonas TaxID=2615206 RepID=UPI0006F79CA2|nr:MULTISPECIES: porin [unclassified Aureimonas]KQT65955.1 hypothetical protein ASG62_20725 [Aureimonas sp. Leaf427]KQT73314.1 hypothetical protein ASG54_17205 [Aureimonas sp. Leaf460]
MTLKSLLFASAAALVGATAAQAADAVTLVEAEPADYVRVCDVYGKGFFYIPGTETCLKMGGYIRMRVQGADQEYNDDIDLDRRNAAGTPVGEDYTVGTRTRARLEFDAREETELGTLRSKARLEATNTFGADTAFNLDEGFIQLGGLTVGYLDTLWTNNENGVEDGLLLDEFEFSAGDLNANRISYTLAAKGFTGTVSLEDDGTGDFLPDVVGKLSYKGDWGGAYLLGVYDEDSVEETNSRRGFTPAGIRSVFALATDEYPGAAFDQGKDGAFAVKGGLLLNDLVAKKSVLKVEGHYAFDPTIYARVDDIGRFSTRGTNDFNQPSLTSLNGGRMNFSSRWQAGAAYRQDIGKLFLIANGMVGETFDLSATSLGVNYGNVGAIDYWGAGGDIGYKLTSNFTVKAEVSYVDLDMPARIDDFDQTRGFLEFRRDF